MKPVHAIKVRAESASRAARRAHLHFISAPQDRYISLTIADPIGIVAFISRSHSIWHSSLSQMDKSGIAPRFKVGTFRKAGM
jgi:hypothetical protein